MRHPSVTTGRRMLPSKVPMRESAIQAAVCQHWRMFGRPHTLVAAIPNEAAKGQAGLTKGLPDLLVIGGTVRLGFIELKVPTGRLSLEQKTFRNLCAFCSIPFVEAYGRDEPIKVLEDWGILRRQVGAPSMARPTAPEDILRRARDGQSPEGIAIAYGMPVEDVRSIIVRGRP
ncbi:VRR-NUC domain-containing protein [Methylobacterium sp. J-092]|uniref:VRR-NUC domain-containing protein n=1 Tax=Methylobacterium sp. J-092 TaxID=2836667 RepID=UPI001FBAC1B4|nr:VRR-NUC domain-containing protein [Methylobacterium sp. J-092]MCJ2009781.1 VRR-NUC domain-containing protein [Methylobacterium sp. J-092]